MASGGSTEEGSTEEDELDSVDETSEDAKNSEASFGTAILKSWKKRRVNLSSDLAIAGWMLCPIEEIFIDMKANQHGDHRKAMERVVKQLYTGESDNDSMGQQLDTFWTEYEQFLGKRGDFSSEYKWNSQHLKQGNSYLWHKQYSYPYTEMLGKVACRVTSKILGIGSAERAWGAVKHLKTNKRAHLRHKSMEMQSTIFVSACMESARIRRNERMIDPGAAINFWTDDDFDVNLESWGISSANMARKQRIFRCWVEEWEQKLIDDKDKGPVAEAKLWEKYKHIVWTDPDNDDALFTATSVLFRGGKKNGEWYVVGTRADGDTEPWQLALVTEQVAETEQPKNLLIEKIYTVLEDHDDPDGYTAE